MSNPNFVSDLVAMAKAFEELPQVRAELEAKTHDHDVAQQMIQRLELRLMDLKNELDAAHANTRKVEVERDHAEHMFLETDDRLNAFRRLLGSFQTEAGALIAAAEPPVEATPEPVSVEPLQGQSEVPPHQSPTSNTIDSGTEASGGTTQSTDGLSVSSQAEAVSVQPDPMQASPDVPQAPASLSVSAGETSATTESVGSTQPKAVKPEGQDIPAWEGPKEFATAPVDPTASSTAGDGHSPSNATLTTDATDSAGANTQAPTPTAPSEPTDDVGYHNEPQIKAGDGGWLEWDAWCNRMNLRYPKELGGWPPRNAPATA